jgi:hypothetical protein
VDSLESFQNLEEVRWLNISYTPITDLSPLADWQNLIYIAVRGTDIQNFDHLKEVESLEKVDAHSTPSLTDLTGLVLNSGFGVGDTLYLGYSAAATSPLIESLQDKGVYVCVFPDWSDCE